MEKALSAQLKNTNVPISYEKLNKRGCYYTKVPHLINQKGIPGQNLTSLNLDKTSLLEHILMKEYGGDEDLLLGELQFAFVAFLMGHSLEAFLQWKAVVSLLLGCTEAVSYTFEANHLHVGLSLRARLVRLNRTEWKYNRERNCKERE